MFFKARKPEGRGLDDGFGQCLQGEEWFFEKWVLFKNRDTASASANVLRIINSLACFAGSFLGLGPVTVFTCKIMCLTL